MPIWHLSYGPILLASNCRLSNCISDTLAADSLTALQNADNLAAEGLTALQIPCPDFMRAPVGGWCPRPSQKLSQGS